MTAVAHRKIIIPVLCISVITICGLLIFNVYNNRNVFKGDQVKNPDQYILRFDEMNREDTHYMTLGEGDTLSVDFKIERGRANLVIGEPDKDPVFTGNEIESGTFELIIPSAGTYKIMFKAKHAEGFIKIYAHSKK